MIFQQSQIELLKVKDVIYYCNTTLLIEKIQKSEVRNSFGTFSYYILYCIDNNTKKAALIKKEKGWLILKVKSHE